MKNKNNENAKVNYDRVSDSLYIIIKKDFEEGFIELAPGINLEFNKAGAIIGFEILNFTKFLHNVEDLEVLNAIKANF